MEVHDRGRTTNHGSRWDLLATGIVTIPQAGDGTLRVYGRLLALDASGNVSAKFDGPTAPGEIDPALAAVAPR